MHLPKFPPPFRHEHPPILDVGAVFQERLTAGQRAADRVAAVMGSWPFVIGQTVLLALWVALNVLAWARRWDPYPFILLNLLLSMQAAYAAPIIMMSQNRQAMKDRMEAHHDFQVDQKAELEVRVVLEHLDAQNLALQHIAREVAAIREDLLPRGRAR